MRAALRIDRRTATAVLHQRAVRLMASNGDAGRAFSFRPFVLPARSPRFHRGGPGAAPGRATIFLKEAPALDPKPGNVSPYRIHLKPAGGPSPAGAEFTSARVA